jgi:hypothetical protein
MSTAFQALHFDKLEKDVGEIKDRCRRMETRLTRYMEAQGFDTTARPPTWREGEITIPSPAVSLKDILNVIPDTWGERGVAVIHKGAHIAHIHKLPKGE